MLIEMLKNRIQDELEDKTLKTIEVINIADLRIEKDNLERQIEEFRRKQDELDKVEKDLEREKEKMEEKKRKRLGRK